jgi:hypothetical protein
MTAQTKVYPSAEVHPPTREQAMEKRHLKVCDPEKQVCDGIYDMCKTKSFDSFIQNL